eukprot:1497792-Pyramimonas_sp.AAC.2
MTTSPGPGNSFVTTHATDQQVHPHHVTALDCVFGCVEGSGNIRCVLRGNSGRPQRPRPAPPRGAVHHSLLETVIHL